MNVPGLAGYLAAQQQNQQADAANLNTLQGAIGLQGALAQQQEAVRKAQIAQQSRAELAALGPNPSQEALTGWAAKYAGPNEVLKVIQGSQDKQAQVAAQRQSAIEKLENQQRYENMMHEFRMTTAANKANTDAVRAEETARHNRAIEALQGQLAQMRGENAARTEAERAEKTTEAQVARTQSAMKDIMPVYTAANQLNRLLTQYTPDNVPGIGYAKNTDMGKAFLSQEGKDVASSVKLVGNSILKMLSGTAVTAPEEVRQMAAQMADGRFSAKDFYVAWPKVSEWINSQVKLGLVTLNDTSRPIFEQRTGMNFAPINPRFTFQNGQLHDTIVPAPPAQPAARATSDKGGKRLRFDAQGNLVP